MKFGVAHNQKTFHLYIILKDRDLLSKKLLKIIELNDINIDFIIFVMTKDKWCESRTS